MCKGKKMFFRKDQFKHIYLFKTFKIILWKQNVCAGFCWDKVIFFLVARKALCFGFVTKPVLTIHQCFSSCWAQLAQCPALPCFTCCPASEEAESAPGAGGDAARTAGPDCPDVPGLVASCSGIKRGQLAGGCCSGTGWAPVSCWWAVALCITCFICSYFLFGSLPCPSGGVESEWRALWCLAGCWVKPPHTGHATLPLSEPPILQNLRFNQQKVKMETFPDWVLRGLGLLKLFQLKQMFFLFCLCLQSIQIIFISSQVLNKFITFSLTV